MTQSFHDRLVRHHEKDRWILGGILVSMVIPEGDDEGVAFFPLVAFIADGGYTASFPHMIDRGTCVPVSLGLFIGTEHVNLTRHGWKRRSAGQRVGIL